MNNGANNEMNAKKIVKNMFLGSSEGLPYVRVKELIFIPGKNVHLSILEAFFPRIQQG